MNDDVFTKQEAWRQVRRRQLDDIRRRLAAVDLDDDDDDSWRCRQSSDEAESETGTCRGSRLDDHVKCNRARSIDNGVDEDELDRHRKHRHQRLQQAVGSLANSADIGTGVRRGGSVESDCTSRSDRDGSTDGSASASTDTDPDHTCIPTSDVNWRCSDTYTLRENGVVISRVFQVKRYLLQEEARLALQQAQRMAHMQMEVEKHPKKKSPIAEIVGIPHFGDTSKCRVRRTQLTTMSISELQLIVNDLLSQIEELNADLVQLLLDRDELYMQQDSFLVDIDDLTRRGLETVSCYDLRNSATDHHLPHE